MEPESRNSGGAGAIIGSEKGIALLMVLWVMTILMVIALSFTFMTKSESQATLFFKEGAEKKFIAEAGMQRAVMEMFYKGWYKNQPTTLEGSEVVKLDGTKYTGRLGNDYYVYSVLDESAKLNVNLLSDTSAIILNNLLVNRKIPKEQADIIVDSVLDWMDTDDNHRLHGAENEYYMSLPNPYKARNGKFESVEELLLIKGMTQELLYGNGTTPGLINVITVYTKSGADKINLNYASKELLQALPNMTPEMADQIIALRAAGEIKDIEQVKTSLGEAFRAVSDRVTVASEASIYDIESTGFKAGGHQGLSVKAIVEIQGEGKYRCIYYKSPSGITQAPTGDSAFEKR